MQENAGSELAVGEWEGDCSCCNATHLTAVVKYIAVCGAAVLS